MWRGGDKTQERREQGKESGEVRKAKERREEKRRGRERSLSVLLYSISLRSSICNQTGVNQRHCLTPRYHSEPVWRTHFHLWVSLTAAASVFIKASGSQPVRLV